VAEDTFAEPRYGHLTEASCRDGPELSIPLLDIDAMAQWCLPSRRQQRGNRDCASGTPSHRNVGAIIAKNKNPAMWPRRFIETPEFSTSHNEVISNT